MGERLLQDGIRQLGAHLLSELIKVMGGSGGAETRNTTIVDAEIHSVRNLPE